MLCYFHLRVSEHYKSEISSEKKAIGFKSCFLAEEEQKFSKSEYILSCLGY